MTKPWKENEMWVVRKAAWFEGKNYWTTTTSCQSGNQAWESETSLKNTLGLFEFQLEYLENGDTLKYHQ